MSTRSTGPVVLTVTTPVGRPTATLWTPEALPTSVLTGWTQWPHVMPVTWKLLLPSKLRGVLLITGLSLRWSVGIRDRAKRPT
jgi:hypothetical protein